MRSTEPVIRYVGLSKLSSTERRTAEKIAAEYQEKVQRAIQKPTPLRVHFKAYDEEGRRKKYTVTIETLAAVRPFSAKRADWNLARAMHRAFKYLIRQITNQLHSDRKGAAARRGPSRRTVR